jgi:hypothetical protein
VPPLPRAALELLFDTNILLAILRRERSKAGRMRRGSDVQASVASLWKIAI